MIFTPSHFIRVCVKVWAANVVMGAIFGPAKAAKERFCHICICAIGRIGLLVIDALGEIERVQNIPVNGFIGKKPLNLALRGRQSSR